MSTATQISNVLMTAAVAALVIGCSDEAGTSGAPTATSTASAPAAVSTPAPAASAPAPSATETTPPHDCPKGSTGHGSLKDPCEAKGKERMMEVTHTGKTDEKGPSFRVINKSKETILYGKIAVYFYDKAGKQLEVKDAGSSTTKPRPYQPCSGNLFSGVMAPAEKAVVTFSCVKKEHVPEGTATIEAEMQTVGFADSTGKKSEYYWRNNDLAPDARPKGGVK